MADLPPLGSVKVDITANMAQLVRGLKTAQEKTRAATNIMGNDVEKLGSSAKYLGSAFDKYEINLEKVTRKTRKSTKEIGDEFKKSHSKIRVSASGITGGLEKMRMAIARIRNATLLFKFALAATFYAVTRFVKGAVSAYNQQELAERQLAQRIKSTGYAAGMTVGELKDMASSLQKVTTYGDEAIIEMQGLLLTFTNIGRDVMPDAVMATLNMSTALGQDLKSSALMLGKALNDPILGITALSRAGIQFTVEQKEMIKELVETGQTVKAQQMILQEFEKQMGGAAEAARDTFGGSIQALANEFGDVLEKIGRILSDFLTPAVNVLQGAFELLNKIFKDTKSSIELVNEELFKQLGIMDDIAKASEYSLFLVFINKTFKDMAKAEKEANKELSYFDKGMTEFNKAMGITADNTEKATYTVEGLSSAATINISVMKRWFEEWRKGNVAESIRGTGGLLPNIEDLLTWEEIPIDTSWLERWGEIYRQNLTDSEKLAFGIAHLNEVMSEGHMSTELYNREWKRLQEEFGETAEKVDKATKKINQFAIQAARNIQTAFADFLFDPFEKGLQGMLESFINTLRRMAAEMLAAKILFSVFSGTPLGKFFPNPAPQGSSMAGGMLAPVGGAGDVTVMIDGVQVASHIRTLEQFNNRRGY